MLPCLTGQAFAAHQRPAMVWIESLQVFWKCLPMVKATMTLQSVMEGVCCDDLNALEGPWMHLGQV